MSGEAQERNVVMEESNVGAQNSDDTLVVLEFSPKAPAETKEWLTALIKAPGVFVVINFVRHVILTETLMDCFLACLEYREML